MSHYDQELLWALMAARSGETAIFEQRRLGLRIETKPDGTPVTAADKEAEHAIRSVLRAAFPRDGFYGEEGGPEPGSSGRMWLIDPIDGTRGFIRGTPFHSIQIALMDGQDLVVGVSHAPDYGETAWAAADSVAVLNGDTVRMNDVTSVEAAEISFGNIRSLSRSPAAWAALGEIVAKAQRVRGYGDFTHYHLLARGGVDAVIESDVNIWDVAAADVIIRAAGGIVTDIQGRKLSRESRSIVAASPHLHALLLEKLKVELTS